ncbi:S8 family peptidase [Paenibacillus crassostreae]|uniref:Serine protease n=1 Tax=Paenibacillus crassostreae TaxID=1763538 RepID=A0A167C302_9BACL|nr:S8 family peptidase [Paenibacillus crassostreae]AOZ91709.1 peptidase S8 [Paenibacillus crassostreae]OAB72719.1 serine protease [Paenibacillus crassostreae]
MSRRAWTIAGIVVIAGMVITLVNVPRSDTELSSLSSRSNSTANQAANHSIASSQQENTMKHQMLSHDISSTDTLTRMDAKEHLTTMAGQFNNTNQKQINAYIQELQKTHPHIQMLTWIDLSKPNSTPNRGKSLTWDTNKNKQFNNYYEKAKSHIRNNRSYESPSFLVKDIQYFIMAEPSTSKNKGIIALFSQQVLSEVTNHQKRNLRLIPYPKEGNYRIESVDTNTLRDITVKTGHDNEKASHYYENEIVVHFRESISDKELMQISKEVHSKWVRKMGYAYVFHADDMNYSQLKTYFTKKYKPNYVEPHYLYLTNEVRDKNTSNSPIVPNDLLFSTYQWNLPAIETSKGWDLSKGSNDVIIAIIDTGADINHPDLKANLVDGYNVIDPSKQPIDDVGHGTHVAGIIGAVVNNKEGVAGISWYNKVMPVKALDSSGAGTTYAVAEGIIWAADHGAKVMNMSLGNYADSTFLHDAIKYAYDRDVVIIAATGNDNTERPGYPAAYPEVFAVSATDSDMNLASFSNYGDYVDVVAPGASIASTYMGNQYAALSGTSMASPHVAALAGLIRSRNPNLNNEEVMKLMRENVVDLGDQGKDIYFGYGQIDIYQALNAAGNGSSPLQFWPQHVRNQMQSVIKKHQSIK